MKLSQDLQDNIVGWIQGNAFPAAPSSVELALSSTDPVASLTEVGTRQTVVFSVEDNKLLNPDLVVIPNAGGTITHVAILNGDTGDVLLSSPITVPRVLAAGDNLPVGPKEINVELSGIYASGLRDVIYAWLQGQAAPAAPAVFMELSRGAVFNPPSRSDDYLPQPYTSVTPANYVAGTGTTLENDANVLFPDAKTNGWGAISHVFLTDGDKNQYLTVQLSTNKTVQLGESVGFANNAVQFTVG